MAGDGNRRPRAATAGPFATLRRGLPGSGGRVSNRFEETPTDMNGAPEVEQEIFRIIAEQLRVDPARVAPEKRIVDDLWADSLQLVELRAALEEGFDVEIPEAQALTLETVADVVWCVRSQLARREGKR